MSISVSENYHATIIRLRGKFLGSLHGSEFKGQVDTLKAQGKTHVVVDLGETDFMDSSGVGALIGAHTSLREAGGDIRLANLTKRIHGLFRMTHLLGPVFECYDSVEEATQSFGERPEPRKPLPTAHPE